MVTEKESTPEECLDGFKEDRSELRIWSLDSAFDSGNTNHHRELDQERDSTRDLGGEVENVLICMLSLGNEE